MSAGLKTTLVRMIKQSLNGKTIYLDLELPSDLAKLEDSELYLRHHQEAAPEVRLRNETQQFAYAICWVRSELIFPESLPPLSCIA